MTVPKSNNGSNPTLNASQSTPMQLADELRQCAEGLTEMARSAAETGESFDSVERRARESLAMMGNRVIELFLALQGDGDLGEELQTPDGKTLKRSEQLSDTKIRSMFGQHSFRQYTYAPGKNKAIELKPLSSRMSLPDHRWSLLLQELSQIIAVDCSFEQTNQRLVITRRKKN